MESDGTVAAVAAAVANVEVDAGASAAVAAVAGAFVVVVAIDAVVVEDVAAAAMHSFFAVTNVVAPAAVHYLASAVGNLRHAGCLYVVGLVVVVECCAGVVGAEEVVASEDVVDQEREVVVELVLAADWCSYCSYLLSGKTVREQRLLSRRTSTSPQLPHVRVHPFFEH